MIEMVIEYYKRYKRVDLSEYYGIGSDE